MSKNRFFGFGRFNFSRAALSPDEEFHLLWKGGRATLCGMLPGTRLYTDERVGDSYRTALRDYCEDCAWRLASLPLPSLATGGAGGSFREEAFTVTEPPIAAPLLRQTCWTRDLPLAGWARVVEARFAVFERFLEAVDGPRHLEHLKMAEPERCSLCRACEVARAEMRRLDAAVAEARP